MARGILFVAAIAAIVACASGMLCPDSPVSQHAGCEVTVQFKNACGQVRDEIENRVIGQYNRWHDPHNNGTYTLDDISSDSTWYLHRLTGDLKYTDKMIFTFTPTSTGGCAVTACSESQVFSIGDYGTNYCNVHDLYCADSSCRPFVRLSYTEKIGTCTEASLSACYQV